MTNKITVLKIVLYAAGAIVFLIVGLVFGLRYEFARVSQSFTVEMAMRDAVVKPLSDTLSTSGNCSQQYPFNNAWFGALHIHTAASYDATAFGVQTTVDDAYSFGRGTPLPLRLRGDPSSYEAPVLQISSPLDFMAVTDHAEGLGEVQLCYTPGSDAWGTLVCRLYRGDIKLPVDEKLQPIVRLATLAIFGKDRSVRVCGKDGSACRAQTKEIWHNNQRSTELWLDHSSDCTFTTFHAYEYTLAEESSNLHRNVIFKTDTVPQDIVSAKEAPKPEMLLQWLEQVCLDGSPACDVLVIPHNSNWSSGRMWFPPSATGKSFEERQALAKLRQRLEPLAEILQVKGDSECRNGIPSVLGAADEFCDFEKLRPPQQTIADCGDAYGSGGMLLKGCVSRNSYLRYALATGLSEHKKLGVNPFKFGIIAATDTHNGAPAAGLEKGHRGSHGTDRNADHRLLSKVEVPGDIATGSPVRYNPGGIAGVYAVENSRDALFNAMTRRETFGTSGPRITPRFFAGWNMPVNICKNTNFLQTAYEQGVPMGGDLPSRADDNSASPVFVASASADGRPGRNLLQRIQIIKAWVDDEGQTHQAVYDIAGDPDNGAKVDPNSCVVSGPGYSQLCASWSDPDFNPDTAAIYYSRVLENPSCRWSQYDCISLAEEDRPQSCSDPDLPKIIQERAWTSPIWYQPG